MTPAPAVARPGFREWLARAFLAAMSYTVLAYGSASTVQSSFAAIAFAILALLSTSHPIGSLRVGRVQAASILLLAGLFGYAAFQALPLAGADLANGAWKSVEENIGPASGTISVAPGMTLDALSSLALPFLAFISALAFFQADEEALWLWRALAYFGTAYAAFGILQELLLPLQLLLEPKQHYVGSLTATFVNRNTAGTFFGIALLLNLGLEFHELRKIRIASFAKKALNFDIGWRDKNALVLVYALCCLNVGVALFLTQSRGAVGATFVACVAAVALIATRRVSADKPNDEFVGWRRYAALAAGLLVIIGLFALFAGRSVYRMEAQGSEDARWCAFASTIAAIKDNWILGTGLGAFQDVFPVYRDADCAGIFGVWERAHNFFLEGFLGLGLPFVAALTIGYLILVGVLIRGIRVRRQFRFIPVMGLAALILATLHSIVDFSLQILGVAVYFAAVMAAATTVSLGRGGE
jgi:hypothetical protein